MQSFKPVQRECKLLLVRMLLFYIYLAEVLNGYSGCKSLAVQAVPVLIFDFSPSSNIAKWLWVKGHLLCISYCCLSKYKIQWLVFLACSVISGTIFPVSEDKSGTVSTAL